MNFALKCFNIIEKTMSDTVMLIGSGTREHRIAKALNDSPYVKRIVWAPGNAGAYSLPKVVKGLDYSKLKVPQDYLRLAKESGVQFATTGMEQYLFQGIADEFRDNRIRFFGPGKTAAELERQKAVAKCYLTEWEVPTADFGIFASAEKAHGYIGAILGRKFVKVSGPALGKGALPGETREKALEAVYKAKEFGDSAKLLVIEDTLRGKEASDHVLLNTRPLSGEPVFVRLRPSKDYKRVGRIYRKDAAKGMVAKGDTGAQTGGMAAYSPPSFCTKDVSENVKNRILSPIFTGLIGRGTEYCGVLYTALMIDNKDPFVIELNVRPGSPESEVLDYGKDIYEAMNGVIDGTLKQEDIHSADDYTVGVVLASGPIEDHPGYPEKDYKTGYRIEGLDEIDEDVDVLFGGVALAADGKTLITNGGRVMMLAAQDETAAKAKAKVIANAEKVRYDNKYYRDDVAYEEGV